MNKQINLTQNLDTLNEIAQWFDQQTQVDVEEGLKKVKEAARLIKESKARLSEIENEFIEIQADMSEDIAQVPVASDSVETVVVTHEETVESTTNDIPF